MQLDWGLGAFEDAVEQVDLLRTVWTVAEETRRRNADRFESKLGDDAMACGFTTFRNVANLLEAALDGVEGVTVTRPSHSFEIRVGEWVIGVYGLSSCDPNTIRWTGSLRKLELAESNSAVAGEWHSQPSLDEAMADAGFDDEQNALKPRQVVIVHWADAAGRNPRMWFGFPRDNTRGGDAWLELREYRPETQGASQQDVPEAPPASPTYRDGKPGSYEIKMRPSDGPDSLPGGASGSASGA
jgi:hypothetical protein